MKYKVTFALSLLLALTACDSGRQSSEPMPEAPPAVQDETSNAAPDTSAENPADAEDGAPKLVEESAAVSDDLQPDDQPIKLARANTAKPAGDWQFQEGEHFQRLVPTQPTVGGADKIEVAEFFWYGCGHCRAFEPYINEWAENKPANVRFVRIPAVWNPLVKMHAQLYYTEQVLAENGKIENPDAFRAAVFQEYHQRRNRLASPDAIQAFFESQGVSAEDFQAAWNSFQVAQKLRLAEDLARRYSISAVPTIVVNGKYRAGATANGFPELIRVIEELVARETVR